MAYVFPHRPVNNVTFILLSQRSQLLFLFSLSSAADRVSSPCQCILTLLGQFQTLMIFSFFVFIFVGGGVRRGGEGGECVISSQQFSFSFFFASCNVCLFSFTISLFTRLFVEGAYPFFFFQRRFYLPICF